MKNNSQPPSTTLENSGFIDVTNQICAIGGFEHETVLAKFYPKRALQEFHKTFFYNQNLVCLIDGEGRSHIAPNSEVTQKSLQRLISRGYSKISEIPPKSLEQAINDGMIHHPHGFNNPDNSESSPVAPISHRSTYNINNGILSYVDNNGKIWVAHANTESLAALNQLHSMDNPLRQGNFDVPFSQGEMPIGDVKDFNIVQRKMDTTDIDLTVLAAITEWSTKEDPRKLGWATKQIENYERGIQRRDAAIERATKNLKGISASVLNSYVPDSYTL